MKRKRADQSKLKVKLESIKDFSVIKQSIQKFQMARKRNKAEENGPLTFKVYKNFTKRLWF